MQKFLITTLFAGLLISSPAAAIVNIGLSGSASTSNFSLETHRSTAMSANISIGLWSFLHIGLTHRRSFENKSGFKKASPTPTSYSYIEFRDNTESVTNSVDLTLFLSQGTISPFVFGGVARRDYITEIEFQDQRVRSTTTLYPVPNYGVGASIRLSMKFQLNLTHTFTPGLKTTVDDNGEENSSVVNDSYTQMGITYRI
ncbi:MAG: hypothetical protein ACOH5I_15225 [Oligoflexus sp.]